MPRARLRLVASLASVWTLGVILAFQGWNSRYMDFDDINFIDAAARLLSEGTLPDRGDVSSYGGWATPGTAWLMLPGMLVFDDPRLYESIGSAALYFGTLLGVFLLARMCFGQRCGYLALVLYGLSRNGLFTAGSLYAIGHPFFYVWMVYLCIQWVQRRDAYSLAAALLMWAAGMYVDMVLAPAIFIVPVLWILYHPPIRLTPLALAAVTSLIIWSPYLRFETARDFADIKAVVMRRAVRPVDYKASWCEPTRVVYSLSDPTGLASGERRRAAALTTSARGEDSVRTSLAARVRARLIALRDGLTFNFDQMAWTPMAALPLAGLAFATVGFVALQTWIRSRGAVNPHVRHTWISRGGWALIIASLLVNEAALARLLSTTGALVRSTILNIRILQMVLFVAGAAVLLARTRITTAVQQLIVRERMQHEPPRRLDNRHLFALCVLVAWCALLAVVEPGYAVRYFWLWPLEMILVVAAVTYIPERLGWPRAIGSAAQGALIVALLTHPWVVAPVTEWMRTGWSGPRADDIRALDYIAADVRADGQSVAAVGYHTYFAEFMATTNIVDPRYKVGGEYDLFLKHRYGIANSDRCAEGFSPRDDYRIVQRRPLWPGPDTVPVSLGPMGGELKAIHLWDYFDVSPDPLFHMVQRFGDYSVFKRIPDQY